MSHVHSLNRTYERIAKVHVVPAFSLESIIYQANPTGVIDFLSVDIEGLEYLIFKSLNFAKFEIKAICVEHNHTSKGKKLKELIVMHGYQIVFEEYSGNDYWFIRNDSLI